MTVMVDDLFSGEHIYHGERKAQAAYAGARHGHQWCHMISDQGNDAAELHEMAARLGLKRAWFQGDHYDLVPTKRARAVRLGAVEISRQEAAMITLYDNKGRERPAYGRVQDA